MWTWIVVGVIFVGFVLVVSLSGAYDKHPAQNSKWWKKASDQMCLAVRLVAGG